MRTLPSHIATTVLVAICEDKVHMIFSWSSKGTQLAPLENNDIMFTCTHFISSHFVPGSSIRIQVISNQSHFAQCSSFHSILIISSSGHRPEELYWGGFSAASVSLSVNLFVDRLEFFRYLHSLILKGTFWPSFKKNPPSCLEGGAIGKCLQMYGKTDRWTNGCRRDPPQKSSSTSSSAYDQGTVCEGIIHTLRIQPSRDSIRMVAICWPVGTHGVPSYSYMRRELYAAFHYNLHFIVSQVLMPELKEDDAELDLGLALTQFLQQRRRRTPRRVWVRPWILRRGGVSLGMSDACRQNSKQCRPWSDFPGSALFAKTCQN